MKLDGLSEQTISRIDKARRISYEHSLEAEVSDLNVLYSPEFSEMLWRPLGDLSEAYRFEDLHLTGAFYRTDKTIFAFQSDEQEAMPLDVMEALGLEVLEDTVSLDGKLLKKVKVGKITYFCR